MLCPPAIYDLTEESGGNKKNNHSHMYIKYQMSGPDQEDFKSSTRGVIPKVKSLHVRRDLGFATSVQPSQWAAEPSTTYQWVQENPPHPRLVAASAGLVAGACDPAPTMDRRTLMVEGENQSERPTILGRWVTAGQQASPAPSEPLQQMQRPGFLTW